MEGSGRDTGRVPPLGMVGFTSGHCYRYRVGAMGAGRACVMWVFSREGFVSVVENLDDSEELLVRARDRRHLERISKNHGLKTRIWAEEGSDYQWRMLVKRADWRNVMVRMVDRIDYNNFKGAVQGQAPADPTYLKALHNVWSTVAEEYGDRD